MNEKESEVLLARRAMNQRHFMFNVHLILINDGKTSLFTVDPPGP